MKQNFSILEQKHNFPPYLMCGTNVENLLSETKRLISDKLGSASEYNQDFLLVSSETQSISITQIRDLIEYIGQTAFTDLGKFAVIYEADKMTDNAANACLKMLEDTPNNAHIFLITAYPYKLPITILSRCFKIKRNDNIDYTNYDNTIASIVSDPLSMITKLEQEFENIATALLRLMHKFSKIPMLQSLHNDLSAPELVIYNNIINKHLNFTEIFTEIYKIKNKTMNKHLDKTQSYLLIIDMIL